MRCGTPTWMMPEWSRLWAFSKRDDRQNHYDTSTFLLDTADLMVMAADSQSGGLPKRYSSRWGRFHESLVVDEGWPSGFVSGLAYPEFQCYAVPNSKSAVAPKHMPQPSLNLDLARHTQRLGAFLQLKLVVVWSRPAAFDTPLQRNCHAAWKVSRDRKITARFPGPQATFGGYGAVREQGFVPEHASRRAAPSNGRRLTP